MFTLLREERVNERLGRIVLLCLWTIQDGGRMGHIRAAGRYEAVAPRTTWAPSGVMP